MNGKVLLMALLVLVWGATPLAEELVPEKKPDEVKKTEGWDFLLTPGASLSLSDNRSVIGQAEGLTMTLGASLAGAANFRSGPHEWRSTLNITELFSHTPTLNEFVKSTDLFKIESIYLFHLIDWLGPFAKLNLDTAMLEGFDVRPEPVTWRITYLDGTSINRTGLHLRLTDGFEPLGLKETAGFFAKPYASAPLNIEGRLGFGGSHVLAKKALTVKDDKATPEIEVVELASMHQAGGVLELALYGELMEKKMLYRLGAEFMMPFLANQDEGDTRALYELTNIEFSAKLTFKVFEWLNIEYVLRAVRQPQLLDKFQVQNNLLVTASYDFFKPQQAK